MTTLAEAMQRRAESIPISMDYVETGDDGRCLLQLEVRDWLREQVPVDDMEVCNWWIDSFSKPKCARIWLKDENLRVLFKLAWGGK